MKFLAQLTAFGQRTRTTLRSLWPQHPRVTHAGYVHTPFGDMSAIAIAVPPPEAPLLSRRGFFRASARFCLTSATATAMYVASTKLVPAELEWRHPSPALPDEPAETSDPAVLTLHDGRIVPLDPEIAAAIRRLEECAHTMQFSAAVEHLTPSELYPTAEIVEGCVYTPIIEELLFRAVPCALVRILSRDSLASQLNPPTLHTWLGCGDEPLWGPGIAAAAAFSAFHPTHVASFLGGLLHWKLMRLGGIHQAMIAHSVHNLLSARAIRAEFSDKLADLRARAATCAQEFRLLE